MEGERKGEEQSSGEAPNSSLCIYPRTQASRLDLDLIYVLEFIAYLGIVLLNKCLKTTELNSN